MKLRDVPDPVWYAVLGVVAVGAVWFFGRRAAAAVGDAVAGTVQAAGSAAYSAGNAVQNAVVPGEDSLGTWAYGVVDSVRGWFGDSDADRMAQAQREPTGSWADNGTDSWFFDYDKLEDPRSSYPIVPTPAGEPRRPGVNVPRFSRPY